MFVSETIHVQVTLDGSKSQGTEEKIQGIKRSSFQEFRIFKVDRRVLVLPDVMHVL